MDPKAVATTIQRELQQHLQDLLGIDGQAQSRKSKAPLSVRRNKGSNTLASSTRTRDEEAEARASVTSSQGFEERPRQWMWKEEEEGFKGCGKL